MQRVLRAALAGLQLVDDQLDVLRGIAVRDEHGVGRLDDHEIPHADGRDHAGLAADVRVVRAGRQHVAVDDIAVGGLGLDLPEGVP